MVMFSIIFLYGPVANAGGTAKACLTIVSEFTNMIPEGTVKLDCVSSNPSRSLGDFINRKVCWEALPLNQTCNFDLEFNTSICGKYGPYDGKWHSSYKFSSGKGTYDMGTIILERDCDIKFKE